MYHVYISLQKVITNLRLVQLQLHYHAYKCSLCTVCVSATKAYWFCFMDYRIRKRFLGTYTLIGIWRSCDCNVIHCKNVPVVTCFNLP